MHPLRLISPVAGCPIDPPALAAEPGKGHVSVNPVYGCRVGCPFCISQADPWADAAARRSPRLLASVPALLAAIEAARAQIAPLKISLMDFCDPFDPALRPTLRALIEGIEARLPGQAVILTTRLDPADTTLDHLAARRRIDVSVFVSLGDALGGVPPVTPVDLRLRLLAASRARGLHTVLLLRPLVAEWTRRDALRALLERAAGHCDEVVIGGLRMDAAIERSLRGAGWPVPAAAGEIDASLQAEVVAMAAEILGNVPVSTHRSCAVNRRRAAPCRVAPDPDRPDAPRACQQCSNWADARGYCVLRAA